MPEISSTIKKTKIKVPVVFVIDASGNSDEYTKNLNEELWCLTEEITSLLKEYPEYQVVISVVTYSSDVKIVADAVLFEDFYWDSLKSGGASDLGKGLSKLESVIEKSYYMSKTDVTDVCMVKPIITLITRNHPTDNFVKQLEILNTKDWFVKSDRLAFYYGEETDYGGMFEDFTGNIETTNLPISKFCYGVSGVLKSRFTKYQDCTGDFAMSDLVIIDSPDSNKNFIVSYPSKTNVNVNVNGVLELRRCQITSCSPKNAQDVVLRLEDKDDWLFVTNVSEMPLIATFTVSSLECRRIPHDSTDTFEILANPSVSSKLSLAVKVDFDTFGYMSITNNSDFDVSVRHTIGCQGMYLRQDDYVTIGEGIQILKVIKGGKVANDWDDWDWD